MKNILLAHLDSTNVKVGQVLKPGTRIGVMGNTGESTDTHLHYSGLLEGDNVTVTDFYRGNRVQSDPRPYLRENGGNWFCGDAVMSCDWHSTVSPYSPSRKHLGFDTAFLPSKKGNINNNKDTNIVIEIGFDIYFGNYVILGLKYSKTTSPSTPPTSTKIFKATHYFYYNWKSCSESISTSKLTKETNTGKYGTNAYRLKVASNGYVANTRFKGKTSGGTTPPKQDLLKLKRTSPLTKDLGNFDFKNQKSKFSKSGNTYTLKQSAKDTKGSTWAKHSTFYKR